MLVIDHDPDHDHHDDDAGLFGYRSAGVRKVPSCTEGSTSTRPPGAQQTQELKQSLPNRVMSMYVYLKNIYNFTYMYIYKIH